jgi:O-antigen/teichoic acid export membrane protein
MREKFLEIFTSNQLAKNSLWMFAGFGVRFVTQFFYFILVARTLGVSGYGTFVGVVSLVAIFVPFSSLGTGNLLVKNVSREQDSFRIYWGNALAVTCLSAASLFLLVLFLSRYILPSTIPILLVVMVCVSDLFFAAILSISGQVFQAFEDLKGTAKLYILISVSRLAAAVLLSSFFVDPSPVEWGALYLISTAFAGTLSFVIVMGNFGPPRLKFIRDRAEIREGFHFSLTLSSQSIYNDIDKTMLVRLHSLNSAGIYAAAYRLCDAVFMPVSAVLYAAYARFFQHGEKGVRGSFEFSKKILPFAGLYSILAGGLLFLLAPYVPMLLGVKYTDTVEALRWLSLLPFLKSLHYFGADTLTGAGFQEVRSYIQMGVAVFNVGLNLVLIPSHAWRGAAWASIATDALLAVSIWCVVYFYMRKSESPPERE